VGTFFYGYGNTFCFGFFLFNVRFWDQTQLRLKKQC
jgi:hypothetical protein